MLTFPIVGALLLKLFFPILFVVAVCDVLTQNQTQRVRRLYRSGRYSERGLAARLGITRYKVRMALA